MTIDARNQPHQRIRIGLTGLAFVFLLVLLGTAISRSGNNGAEQQANLPGNAAAAEPNEPLAEIGAAPSQSVENNAKPER
jgi:hypothetical protein